MKLPILPKKFLFIGLVALCSIVSLVALIFIGLYTYSLQHNINQKEKLQEQVDDLNDRLSAIKLKLKNWEALSKYGCAQNLEGEIECSSFPGIEEFDECTQEDLYNNNSYNETDIKMYQIRENILFYKFKNPKCQVTGSNLIKMLVPLQENDIVEGVWIYQENDQTLIYQLNNEATESIEIYQYSLSDKQQELLFSYPRTGTYPIPIYVLNNGDLLFDYEFPATGCQDDESCSALEQWFKSLCESEFHPGLWRYTAETGETKMIEEYLTCSKD